MRHLTFAFIAASAACMLLLASSCKDDTIPESPGRNETYDREFVKAFGNFTADWSEARSKCITVKTDHPTPVRIFAEVGGERYIFASLGHVNGSEPIIVNVPKDIEDLIVVAEGEEYNAKVGSVLDLTEKSSRSDDTKYPIVERDTQKKSLTITTSRTGVPYTITYTPEDSPEFDIKRRGAIYMINPTSTSALKIDQKITFEELSSLKDKQSGSDKCLFSSAIRPNEDLYFDIFPLYWRENQYGESDYKIGIYVYDANKAFEYAMMDLDINFKDFITMQYEGTEKPEIAEKTVKGVKMSYDYTDPSKSKNDLLHSKGIRIKVKGYHATSNVNIGIYVKSGMLGTTTDTNFGEDCKHISAQGAFLNYKFWGDNHWDMQLKDIQYSYVATALNTSYTNIINGAYVPTETTGKKEFDSDGNEIDYLTLPMGTLGFSSQPDGTPQYSTDNCDVVFAIRPLGIDVHKTETNRGEGDRVLPWTLACEDLGGSFDWDFNDAVVNVYDITTDYTQRYTAADMRMPVPSVIGRRVVIVPRAAGGTMPIYLMYEGNLRHAMNEESYFSEVEAEYTYGTYMLGTELHRWLGASNHANPLNVNITQNSFNEGCAISFDVPINEIRNIDPSNPPQNLGDSNSLMQGLWVLVDPQDDLRLYERNPLFDYHKLEPFTWTTQSGGVNVDHTMPQSEVLKAFSRVDNVYTDVNADELKLGSGPYRVEPPAKNGHKSPQMLMCYGSWYWPMEMQSISFAWYNFDQWVSGKTSYWHTGSGGNDAEGLKGYNPDVVIKAGEPLRWME